MEQKLGKRAVLVPAHASEMHRGVLDADGKPVKTPHHFFVDDDVYAEVYDIKRIEMTIACGIEALFRILGESDLQKRQDPVSWDKLLEMIINFINKILGLNINTRSMRVAVPCEYTIKVIKLMENHWFKPNRKAFKVQEAAELAGKLAHISNSSKCLKHLMPHLYTSMAASIKGNKSHLMSTNKQFRDMIKKRKWQ